MPLILTDESFHKVLTDEKPVIVEFKTDWCGTCHIMTPIIEDLEIEFIGQVIFYKMDADASKKVTHEYDIKGLPTLLFFKKGQCVGRIAKAVPKQIIIDKITTLILEK